MKILKWSAYGERAQLNGVGDGRGAEAASSVEGLGASQLLVVVREQIASCGSMRESCVAVAHGPCLQLGNFRKFH